MRRVLLLHGTPLGPAVWSGVAALLSGREVVVPDCTRVPARQPQRALAAQLAADLDGDLDVVGHSFGGQIAIDFALSCPERIRSLTIVCSRDTPFPPFADAATRLRAGDVPPVEATLARWFTPAELTSRGPVVSDTANVLASASIPDWARALDGIATYDRAADVPSITAPTTIIGAEFDRVSTPEAIVAMGRRIPSAVVRSHSGWAHMSPFAHADDFAGLLEASFRRGDEATSA